MLSALLMLSALPILAVFGNLNSFIAWLEMPKSIFIGVLTMTIILCFLPEMRVEDIVSFNWGGFVGLLTFAIILLASQNSAKEVIKVLIICCLSVLLITTVETLGVFLSSTMIQYEGYIRLFIICFISTIIAGKPGSAVSGCVLSAVAYDVYLGFLQIGEGEIPYLGSEYILQMAVYTMIVGMVLSNVIFRVKYRKTGLRILSRG